MNLQLNDNGMFFQGSKDQRSKVVQIRKAACFNNEVALMLLSISNDLPQLEGKMDYGNLKFI